MLVLGLKPCGRENKYLGYDYKVIFMKVNHKFITKINQVSLYDVFRRLKEIDHTTLRRWADKTNDRYLKRLLLNKVNIMFIK